MRAILQESNLTEECNASLRSGVGGPAGREHGVVYTGSPEFPVPYHFHPQLEFVLVLRGTLRAQIGRTFHDVHAGQLIWHLPGMAHVTRAISKQHSFKVVHVEPRVAASLMGSALTESEAFSSWVCRLAPLVAGRPVVELRGEDVARLQELSDVAPHLSGTRSMEEAKSLLQLAMEATVSDHNDRVPNSIAELASCMLLDKPELARSEVAQLLDVSESYLSRCFQAEFGLSFRDARSRMRIVHFTAHAKSGANMLHAATRSGFGCYSQAHRIFSRVVGMSPRQYLVRGGRQRLASSSGAPYQWL